jgi:hypothetical protein
MGDETGRMQYAWRFVNVYKDLVEKPEERPSLKT